ncbi:calcium-binding protein, partial [Cognatishimia sp. F0-27]|uniref:calcium-binding protein n=1 Tax=Cognatishimia sp. F0-27 TaxID=2816855 RepID=UPI001D1C4238
ASSLPSTDLDVRNALGEVEFGLDSSGSTLSGFTVSEDAVYFFDLGSRFNDASGGYRFSVEQEIAGNISTVEMLEVGEQVESAIDYNRDRDWIRVEGVAQAEYRFSLLNDGGADGLDDSFLRIYSASGDLVTSRDSSSASNALTYVPDGDGAFYISVENRFTDGAGTYILRLTSDLIIGDEFPNALTGSDASEDIRGLAGPDTLRGLGDDDTLSGGPGSDLMFGGAGNDSMLGGQGFDTIYGEDGNDTISGLDGFDSILGGAGDDLLRGNFGNDTIFGEGGDDTLEGGLGFDSLAGGAGADSLQARDGFDTLSGGAGNDTLQGNNGNDSLDGGDGDDRLEGGLGADTMQGDAGADTLLGANGFDLLRGGAGDDLLEGNSGNDTMEAGLGNDVMRGGLGADTFVYIGGADRIVDFQRVDTVRIEADLLAEAAPVPDDLRDYAQLDGDGNLRLDFGDGNTLTFAGVGATGAILGDVEFI